MPPKFGDRRGWLSLEIGAKSADYSYYAGNARQAIYVRSQQPAQRPETWGLNNCPSLITREHLDL